MKREKEGTGISLGTSWKLVFTRKEQEDEAMGLMEKMKKNVATAQQKSFEAEQSLCNAVRKYVDNDGTNQGP